MKTRTIFTSLMIMLSISIYAQRSVYDDDIYYSPKTDAKSSKRVAAEVTKVETTTTTTTVTPSVSETSNNDIDVDAYNRRYSSDYSSIDNPQSSIEQSTTTTTTTQTYYVNGVGGDGMEYAERIRRFHNPEVGLYIVDPEYNNIYLIEDDYTPYVSSINIITTPWSVSYSPWYYRSWRYDPWYYNTWYNNPWRYDPWYWPTAYNPYYPGYYPPRPYPGYRPTPPPPSHKPGYNPPTRPSSNHGHRYTPGGSVGTGGRTDGATRYNGTTSPSRNNQSVAPNRGGTTSKKSTPSYGGRTSSGESNKGTSRTGGSFTRPSYSSPSTSAPSRQSYSPSNTGGGSRMSSGSSIKSSSGRSVGGRGSR